MGDQSRFEGVVAAALDIVALRDPSPARVLATLADVAQRISGLAAGAALVADLDPGGVRTAGAELSRAALVAGFTEGPGAECVRSGRPVLCENLDRERPRWLSFVAKATAAGATAAWALPIRRDDVHLGALLLLGRGSEVPDLSSAGLLAEAAAVAVRRIAELERITEENRQLQVALQSRVVMEQAKGIVAEHADLDVDEAFAVLRTYARRNGHRLGDLAGGIARREIAPSVVLGGPPRM